MTSKTPFTNLNLRIEPENLNLIDLAAQVTGKNRTDFILEAVHNAAEQALFERTMFLVSPEAYSEFIALLDAPSQPNKKLLKTMQTPAPWDN